MTGGIVAGQDGDNADTFLWLAQAPDLDLTQDLVEDVCRPWPTILVSISPGETLFTVTPLGATV